LLFLLVLAITVPALIAYLLWGLVLHLAVWLRWCPRGKNVLFVYSDSPLWHDYLARRILPRLAAQAVVLNWSARKEWERRFSLSALAFSYFGGRREFNPLAVVFRPWCRAKTFRFWQPFQDLKHGQSDALEKMEKELFREIDTLHKN
jgi:hypothetical protein